MVTIKSKKEIELMREAGRVTALTHKAIEEAIKPGMTTADIDKIAEETMKKNGAISAEKGYDPGIRGIPPYPASTCISVNDVVIHGIPSKKTIIKDGDIVVGVSSGGNSPVLARELRKKIEGVIPKNLDNINRWLGEIRPYIKEKISDEIERKKYFEKIYAECEKKGDVLYQDELEEILKQEV